MPFYIYSKSAWSEYVIAQKIIFWAYGRTSWSNGQISINEYGAHYFFSYSWYYLSNHSNNLEKVTHFWRSTVKNEMGNKNARNSWGPSGSVGAGDGAEDSRVQESENSLYIFQWFFLNKRSFLTKVLSL